MTGRPSTGSAIQPPNLGPSNSVERHSSRGNRPGDLAELGTPDAEVLASVMQEIASIVSHSLELEEVIQGVLARVRECLEIGQVVVYVTDSETGDLMLRIGEEPSAPSLSPDAVSREVPRPDLNLPLKALHMTVGTLKAWFPSGAVSPSGEQLLQFVALQLALASERWQLHRRLKDTSQALEEADHFGTGISDGLTDGLVTTDTLGTVTFANRAAEDLAGRPRRSLIGRPLGEAIPSSQDWLVWMATESLITARPILPREVVLLRPDGVSLPVEVRVSVLRGDDRAAKGTVLTLKDLREQKALQQEKHHLDRLAIIGEMSAVVAHEFRTPLAGIKLGVQYLSQHVAPDDPLSHSVSIIAEEVEQMDCTVEDILLISRRFELKLQPCDPVRLVRQALDRLAEDLEASGVQVHTKFAGMVPLVMADPMRMDQVLTNLIRNAQDAMPEGGDLMFSVLFEGAGPVEGSEATREGSAPFQVGSAPAGQVVIKVRDTGEGIPLVALDRIFEPFYTTKSKGTGLGLAIVDRIVREHGGLVAAENAPDGGAEFTIIMPVSHRESSPWQRLSS